MPRKHNESQIKEALERLEKWDGCIGKASSAIGVPPSALKAWAASKENGLLPKEIAAGSRKRYYKGRTEEDVAEILDYYFSLDLRGARHLLP